MNQIKSEKKSFSILFGYPQAYLTIYLFYNKRVPGVSQKLCTAKYI